MSIYPTLDGEIGPQIASNQGWGDFCRWVDRLAQAPDLVALADSGWSEDLDKVELQLRRAVDRFTPNDEDIETIAQDLVSLLHARGDATVLTITDGMCPESTPVQEGEWDEGKHHRAKDGKFGSSGEGGGGAAATTGSQAKKKEKRQRAGQPQVPQASKPGVIRRALVGTLRTIFAGGKAVKSAWEHLTIPEQHALKTVGRAAKELWHRLESPRHVLEKMAVQVAKERGLNEQHAVTVARVLAVASVVEQWMVNIPVAHSVLHELGLEGITNFAVAKVGAFLPVTALAYIGYAAVASIAEGNPLATYRAAKAVLSGSGHHTHEAEESEQPAGQADQDNAALLLSALDRVDGDEWYLALLYAGMEDGSDIGHAVHRADRAYEQQPQQPERRLRESLVEDEHGAFWLLEYREGLVAKQITNKLGRKQTVWVRAEQKQPAQKRNAKTDPNAPERIKAAIAGLQRHPTVNQKQINDLAKLMADNLTVQQLDGLKKEFAVKASGNKKDKAASIAQRIIKKVKGDDAAGTIADPLTPVSTKGWTPQTPTGRGGHEQHTGRAGPGQGSGGIRGPFAATGGPVAGQTRAPRDETADQKRDATGEPADSGTPARVSAPRVPANQQEINKRLDKFEAFFRAKGQHHVADWLGKLRAHINAVGGEEALKSLGEEVAGGHEGEVQYMGASTCSPMFQSMGHFAERYLNRAGIVVLPPEATPEEDEPLVSSNTLIEHFIDRTRDFEGADFSPADPAYADKLEEAKHLPGLEASEDLGVIMGRPTTHITEEVLAKLDKKYGKGQWIVKAYDDEAAAGFGIYFAQRVEEIRRNAQNLIWSAGEQIARHGFEFKRGEDGKIVGIKHKGGDEYDFDSDKFDSTIGGDVRAWCDRVTASHPIVVALVSGGAHGEKKQDVSGSAIDNEHGTSLPQGGYVGEVETKYMIQPAFNVVGVNESDRAAGKTIAPGEARLHVVTRNGKAQAIPHTTWIKGESLPVVFETDDTRAMAKAVEDAIEHMPEEHRAGQSYAPDVLKTVDGYKVVELNPITETGGSGYLRDNPFVIDSYVAHATGRDPAHVRFIRQLLSKRDKKSKGD